MMRYLPDIPAWPQLPKRSFLENMYVQSSQGLPGVAIDVVHERIQVDRISPAFDRSLEALYLAYEEGDFSNCGITEEYATGLHEIPHLETRPNQALKGQITGPISMGLSITDGSRFIIYDDELAEALAKSLHLKAAWMENFLRHQARKTIVFLDEPYLTSLGTSFVALSADKVTSLMTRTLSGISGLKGLHCCGNADWSMLLGWPLDILSFDTYNYVDALGLYQIQTVDFLNRGGAIAWGIVPNDDEAAVKESVSSLKDRLEEAMAPLTRHGIPFKQVVEQSLLTPSCGLASLSIDAADRVLELLSGLSAFMRRLYVT